MANVTKLTLIKFVELVLAIVLAILWYNNGSGLGGQLWHTLSWTTFGGYVIILIGVFAGAIMGTPVNRRIDLYFSLVGAVLFFILGIMILQNSQVLHGVIAIVEGVLFIVDAVFTFRGEA